MRIVFRWGVVTVLTLAAACSGSAPDGATAATTSRTLIVVINDAGDIASVRADTDTLIVRTRTTAIGSLPASRTPSLARVILDGVNVDGSIIEWLRSLPKLRSLELWEVELEPSLPLSLLSECRSLEEIICIRVRTLSSNEVAALSMIGQLRALVLEITSVSGAVKVAPLSSLTDLRELVLRGFPSIQLSELATIAQRVSTLEQLSLEKSGIDVNSEWSDMPRLTHLRFLNLGYTGIRDAAVPWLFTLSALEVLDISGTMITESGLRTLLRQANLKEVILREMPSIAFNEVERIRAEFPLVSFTW